MTPKRITVHCTDTENGKSVGIEEIRSWHKKRGFKDIGYHYVIQVDGTILQGRHFSEQGAHVVGDNEDNLGICLVGRNRYTIKQVKSLMSLIAACQIKWDIDASQIFCHRDFSSAKKQGKTCPNFERELLIDLMTTKDTEVFENHVLRMEYEKT